MPTEPPETRAVLYARVSTEDQVEGTSLDVQVERCQAWASSQGWTVVGTYIDEGVSGALASRPKLDEMLAAVRAGGIQAVVVAKLDRLGRMVSNTSALLAELDSAGVAFVSVAERFDSTTPTGRLARNIAAVFGEHERDVIRERTSSGLLRVAQDGYWPGGPPPFGYRVVRDGRHSRLELDQDEAETVRILAACLVDQRMSTLATARHLNALGRSSRGGGPWDARMVRHLATTGLGWSGTWQYRRGDRRGRNRTSAPVEVAVPAILSPETHQAVMAAVERTTTGRGSTTRKHAYLLSGLVISPHGRTYQGITNSSGLRMMRCAGRDTLLPPSEQCSCRRVPAETIERLVWEEVVKALSDPDELRKRAAGVMDAMTSADRPEDLAALKRRVSKAEKALADAFARAIRVGLDDAALALATRTLSDELDLARQRLAQAQSWAASNADARSRVERIWALADHARRHLVDATPERQRQILEILGVRVQITGWVPCATCAGKGVVPAEPDAKTGKREKGWHGFGACPTCRRTKFLPTLRISGTIPDAVEIARSASDGSAYGFEVEAG